MIEENIDRRLISLVSLVTRYCGVCANALETDRLEFTDNMLDLLPRIYWEFFDISSDAVLVMDESDYFQSYVDEEIYDSIRNGIAAVMGEDDVFLETFEEDMKYSETPIAATVSESLADLYQPLFNFVSVVKDTDGERIAEAFLCCKEDFQEYWSQTLCNVLRALNHIKYSSNGE